MEDPCDAAQGVPVQVAVHRLREPHLSPERGRNVRASLPLALREVQTGTDAVVHPASSGSVCLDVINQTWSPMFGASPLLVARLAGSLTPTRGPADLVNIFDLFIPQLLRYPNPSDPLNGEAASMLMKDAEAYNNKVKGMVRDVIWASAAG